MMEQVLKILHTEDRSVLSSVAYKSDPDNELDAYVSSHPDDLRNALKIDENIFVERNTSTVTKISLLRKFFKAYGADEEDALSQSKGFKHRQERRGSRDPRRVAAKILGICFALYSEGQ